MATDSQRVEVVLFEAIAIADPAARRAHLERTCAGDAELRREVESLIAADAAAGQFLEEPAPGATCFLADAVLGTAAQAAPGVEGVPAEKPGDRIGRYLLLEPVGEGGFGIVWEAEQHEPVRRRVALKILKLGMDTRQVVARFEAERQALALMDHPNIAKVHDGGATGTGRPYFVMELVKGVPIAEYCDQSRLSTRERLGLFIQVCQAVQHAHQKGVIHRDLKPSNILVTLQDGQPIPKVIDFGIAKALEGRLTEATLLTQFHQLIGTPCYMSPEQAGLGNLDVDTRSDIYSLGALLYELLAGQTPFNGEDLARRGLDEMRRTIRECEPPRPSTRLRTMPSSTQANVARQRQTEPPRLLDLLHGDLDWIVMKCLEKDRNRRYATASGLAADIQRHLNHELVVARPPSRLYRFQKMLQRNRFTFAAMSAVATVLVFGLCASLWLFGRERAAHRQAHEAERKATASLCDAYLAEARAHRFSDRAGRRFEGLEAVQRAVALAPHSDERCRFDLRNQAIALLATPDVRIAPPFVTSPDSRSQALITPDGNGYALTDSSGRIEIRQMSDGQRVRSLPGFGFHVAALKFSREGALIAAKYDDPGRANHHVVQVWDVAGGQALLALTNVLKSMSTAFDFHPTRALVAVGHADGSIRGYALPSGAEAFRFVVPQPAARIGFSPDGQWLASAGSGRTNVFILATADGRLTHTLTHPRGVHCLAWHPGGKLLATGTDGGHVFLWDLPAGSPRPILEGHRQEVVRLGFSPDGGLLASAGWDSQVCLWDPVNGGLLCRAPGKVACLALDPARKRLGIHATVEAFHILELAENRVSRTLELLTPTNLVSFGAFSGDGRLLAVATEQGLALWDLTRRVEVRRIGSQRVRAVHFDPQGNGFLLGGNTAEYLPLTITPGSEPIYRLGPVRPLLTSPDDAPGVCLIPGTPKVAFVAGSGETGGILDLGTPSHRIPFRGAAAATTASASPDGRWLATGTWHHRDVVVWDAASAGLVTNLPTGTSAAAFFSPDGRWLVTGSRGQFTQWATGSWQVRQRYSVEPGAGCMAFSPDGRLLALRQSDAELRLINPETGRDIARLPGESPWPVCFSADGTLLAVVEAERRVRLWDLRALRDELVRLNLDWDLPPYRSVPEAAPARPVRIEVLSSH